MQDVVNEDHLLRCTMYWLSACWRFVVAVARDGCSSKKLRAVYGSKSQYSSSWCRPTGSPTCTNMNKMLPSDETWGQIQGGMNPWCRRRFAGLEYQMQRTKTTRCYNFRSSVPGPTYFDTWNASWRTQFQDVLQLIVLFWFAKMLLSHNQLAISNVVSIVSTNTEDITSPLVNTIIINVSKLAGALLVRWFNHGGRTWSWDWS